MLRLYPIYYIICILVLIKAVLFPSIWQSLFSYPTKALYLGTVANITFLGSDWLMFLQWQNNDLHFGNFNESEFPIWQMLLIPPVWSIGIEISFYLLAPTICKLKSRTIFFVGISLLAVRFFGLLFGLNQDPWTYRFFPFELPMFIIGILLYRIQVKLRNNKKINLSKIYFISILFYVSFSYVTSEFDFNRFWQLLVLIVFTCFIIMCGENSPRDKKFGELSYPIYLSHLVVISSYSGLVAFLSRKYLLIETLGYPKFAIPISLLLTFIFSFLLIQLVKPIERIRDKNRI